MREGAILRRKWQVIWFNSMSKVNFSPTDGFHLQGWMVTELGLTGGDLFTFALVHQFSQSGAGIYKGNTSYLSQWTGWTENTSRRHLNRLVEMGLVQELRGRENNSPYCFYKLADDFYEKHPSIIEVSPRKNRGDHPSKIEVSTPQKLRGEYTNTNIHNDQEPTAHREAASDYTDKDFKADLIQLGVTEQTATDWMKVRKKKGGVNTRKAMDGIVREIGKAQPYGFSAEDCISRAVEKSWRGFEAGFIIPELSTDTKKVENATPRFQSKMKINGL